MKNTAAVLGLVVACASVQARAQDEAPTPFESGFAVLGSSLIGPDDKRNPQLDGALGGELRFGGHPSAGGWGYELRLFQESLEKKNGDTGNRGGLGADAVYRFPQFLYLTAYGLAGMALVYSDALPGRDWVAPLVNAGAGLETGPLLQLGGGALRFRTEARYSYEDNRDEYATPTQYDRANYVETRVYAGVSLSFAPPPPPAEPVQVIAPEPLAPKPEPPPVETAPAPPGDGDGDGILDGVDRCADSPLGQPVDAEGCTILKVLTLKGVHFAVNSDQLLPESNVVLDEAVAALNAEFPEARIEVAGHTDASGNDAYNQDLSERRARAVLDYLVGQGVAAARLSAVGYGEAAPVADNATVEGRAQNRRVELRVKSD